MFPIADARGRIVAFGGRGLAADAKPKYINTGETSLFSKGHLLYNLKPAREAAAKGAPLILAEGYMDVIALVRAGFEGAVAPLGTALTEDQLAILWKVAPEPMLCFDGDEAGTRAAHARGASGACRILCPANRCKFVFLPKGEDPDTLPAQPGRGADARAARESETARRRAVGGRDRGPRFLHAGTARRAWKPNSTASCAKSRTRKSPIITAAISRTASSALSSSANAMPPRAGSQLQFCPP